MSWCRFDAGTAATIFMAQPRRRTLQWVLVYQRQPEHATNNMYLSEHISNLEWGMRPWGPLITWINFNPNMDK